MVKITRYLDPNPGGEGNGGGSIFDVGLGNAPGANPPAGTPPAGGGATPSAPTAEQIAADTALFESLSAKDEASLTADEKAKLADLKARYEAQETDDEGNPITPEQKKAKQEAEAKIAAIKAKPENQRTLEEIKFLADNEAQEASVYDKVDELTGVKLQINYEGADPLSPEGILKREEAIREYAIEAYDAELKQSFPQAYQYLLHLQAGGDPASFFAQDTDDYQAIVLVKEDKVTQEKIYRKALSLRGNTEDQIDALVQVAKDKGKLYENSKVELEALQRKQVLDEQNREKQAQANKAAELKLTKDFYAQVGGLLSKGVNGVVIPLEERQKFMDFVTSNTYVRDGKLIYYRELKLEEIESELAMNYFKFKKADLSKLVERKANSLNAQDKRNKIKVKLVPKSSSAPAPAKTYVPMSQV